MTLFGIPTMRIVLAVCLAMLTSLAAPGARAAEAEEVVRSLVGLVKSFEGASEAEQKEAAQKIHALLDIDGLAERSLLDTWKTLDAAGQKNFVALLKELLAEVAYPQSAKFFKGLQIEYEDGGTFGGRKTILLSITHPDEGLIEIEFFLEPKSNEVQDIAIDGVSLALDIRSQMQKIIKEDGFDELKAKMKKKIEDG